MLPSTELQRVGRDLLTEQQQSPSGATCSLKEMVTQVPLILEVRLIRRFCLHGQGASTGKDL